MIAIGQMDDRGWWAYQCIKCSRTTPHAPSPPLAVCRSSETTNMLYRQMQCSKLGRPIVKISGDILGCNAGDVTLYECERYHEAVTLRALPEDYMHVAGEAAKSKLAEYSGRSCDLCTYNTRAVKPKLNAVKGFTLSDVTVVTTTFKRPEALARFVASIDRFYPGMKVVVVDTEDTADEKLFANISAGRNKAVNSVNTKLTLLLDDDSEFTANTKIELWLDVLNHDAARECELAGVSGTVVEKDRSYSWCHTIDVFRGHMRMLPSNEEWKATPSGVSYRTCDMTINFFLARTEVLRETRWDEDLSLEEHRDWFLRIWNLRKWKWAWTPSVTCLHHRDRNQAYTKFRNRSFLHVAQNKHGLKFNKPILNGMLRMHVDGLSAHLVGKPHLPTAVILGVGHSNTTITAKQFEMLGFNLNDADDEYAESIAVRALNELALGSGRLDIKKAEELLRRWKRPWAVKDPRFAKGTLPMWMQIFTRYTPILFWLEKPLDDVTRSYERRKEWTGNVGRLHAKCKEYFHAWPWAKYRIKTGQIADACAAFDFSR